MPFTSLKISPGIDVEKSPQLNEAGFSLSTCVRFFEGLLQKVGGWLRLNNTPVVGTVSGLHAWADLVGNPYIAAGTEQRLQVFSNGMLYDITPIILVTNKTPAFTTVIHTPTVTITDNGTGAAAGNWINVNIPVAVGGLIIHGLYLVQTIIDGNNYTITATSNASASATAAGDVPEFTTIMSSSNVTVTLANHGLANGDQFVVQVSTTVGGLTIAVDSYAVSSVATNTFVIQPGSSASSGASVFENSGHAQLMYLIPSGFASVTALSGYGVGDYGAGDYGIGDPNDDLFAPARVWFLDNFGQDLIGNYNGSPLYLWVPPATINNVAISIDSTNFPSAASPPATVNVSFVSAPQQIVIALGCDPVGGGALQPLLVRWSDAGDFTDWVPTTTNQAGSYLIPSGSILIGGISAPNFTVIWTDVDMWLMSYLGGTGLAILVWGFTKISGGSGLLSAKSCAIFRNLVFFASSNGFYVFDGNSIHLIPCPVWDIFWFNLDRTQVSKVNAQVNSWFQEVSWAFPSATGTGDIDSRVTYNIRENSWTYDAAVSVTARTAWIDENVYGAPVGADINGYLQQHEVSNDADGSAMVSSAQTGWFSMSEGTVFTFIERLVADFIISGSSETVQITVFVQDWPTDTIRTYGPYSYTAGSGPNFSIVRARGRYAAVQISSRGIGVFWRLGNLRFMTSKSGRR